MRRFKPSPGRGKQTSVIQVFMLGCTMWYKGDGGMSAHGHTLRCFSNCIFPTILHAAEGAHENTSEGLANPSQREVDGATERDEAAVRFENDPFQRREAFLDETEGQSNPEGPQSRMKGISFFQPVLILKFCRMQRTILTTLLRVVHVLPLR